MVILKNIKKNDNYIECDIYPEDSTSCGHILVDTATKDIIEYVLPEGYEWCRNHVNHARFALVEIADQLELPNEKIVMWY